MPRKSPQVIVLEVDVIKMCCPFRAGDVPMGQGRAVGRQPENLLEGHLPIKAVVAVEVEFVAMGVDVPAGEVVTGSKASTLQEGEHPMNPLEWDVRRPVAGDAGIVPVEKLAFLGPVGVLASRRTPRCARIRGWATDHRRRKPSCGRLCHPDPICRPPRPTVAPRPVMH